MYRARFAPGIIALFAAALAAAPSLAFFHAWTFSEFFSNADGSQQFVELVASLSGETQAVGAEIRTDSGNVFSFPGNLSGNTFNKRLLIATPGFGSLPGAVTPDFTLPVTSFFDPAGDRVRLFHPAIGEFHSRTFASVPTDGVTSLNYPPASGTPLTNSPTNFAGASGSVNLGSPDGDFNGDGAVNAADYVLWRSVPSSYGDAQGYTDWVSNFGHIAGSGSTANTLVPEPASCVLLIFGVALGICRRRCVALFGPRTC